jgi:hypothetical protein
LNRGFEKCLAIRIVSSAICQGDGSRIGLEQYVAIWAAVDITAMDLRQAKAQFTNLPQ